MRFACWMNTVALTLGGFVSLRFAWIGALIYGASQGAQAFLGGPVVEEPDQQEQQRPARYARKPEYPLHSKLVESGANQEKQRHCAQCPWKDHTTPMAIPKCLLNHRVTLDTGSTVKMVVETPSTTPKKK